MQNVLKIALLVTALLPCNAAFAQKVVDMRGLLNEMVDYAAMAKWPEPAFTESQASSYDRASVSPDRTGWFANADASQYIRTDTVNGRQEKVMFDAAGPGTIVRFWLTTFKRHGNIRIYLDGRQEPELTIPAYDLLKSGFAAGPALLAPHSSYAPKEKGGSTLYLPIPYARHCKITWEDLDTDNQPRYYQINYRTYAKGTVVKTFSLTQVGQLKPLIDEVNDKLLYPDTVMAGHNYATNSEITKRKPLSIRLPKGPHAIKLIKIRLNQTDTAMDHLMIRMQFDGRQTVYCPLTDFAGNGPGGRPLQSWYRSVTADGKIILRWVMPYQHQAEITLINTSVAPVKAELVVTTQHWDWDSNSLYFHASWRQNSHIPVRVTEKDHPVEWRLLKVKGQGVFMGDTYSVNNLMHAWYGEGDQKFWIDKDIFPSEFGTGTEDYYNTSWAPVLLYQTPFANAPRADNADSYGQNTFTRTRNLDRIPFTHALTYTIEMLGWQNGSINAAAVTYWYGFKHQQQ